MSSAAAFAPAAPVRGVLDFVAAVWRRIDRRSLAWGSVVLVGLIGLAGFGLATMVWDASTMAKLSRLTHTGLAALFVVVAVLAADEAVARGLRPLPTYTVAIVGAAVLGSFAGLELLPLFRLNYNQPRMSPLFAWVRRADVVIICSLVGGLATFAHVSRRNALAALGRQRDAEEARARAERRTLESELQALQARVEPGFLFDTLDRIRALYRVDAAVAGATLEDLIAYLRAALPHLRESASTLGQELELARAWLDIVGRPMAALQVEVETDPALAAARLPAMVLLPLVQRALSDAGGGAVSLRIGAAARGARLWLEVATSTAAFAGDRAGASDALGERLRALYAGRASLRAEAAPPGSRSELEIPLETTQEGSSR